MSAKHPNIINGILGVIIVVISFQISLNEKMPTFVDLPLSAIRLVCFGYILIQFGRNPHLNKLDICFIWFALLYATVPLIYNTSQIIPVFSHIVNISILLGIFNLYSSRINYIIKIFAITFSVIVYANFILMISGVGSAIFDGGWLIASNYNQMSLKLFAATTTNVVYCAITHKFNLNTLLIMIVSVATTLYVGSMTATTGLILLCLCSVASFFRVSRTILPILFVFVMLFHIFVVGMQGDISSMKHLTYFIEEILHKNLTFTGRVPIWGMSVDMFLAKPWFGYGHLSAVDYDRIFGATTPHNIVLWVLLTGGITMFIASFIMCVICVKRTNKQTNSYIVNFLQYAAVICLLMLGVETYGLPLIFFFLILLYNTPVIVAASQIKINKQ